MNNNHQKVPNYIYTYACREEENSLCELELRTIFKKNPETSTFESSILFDPSRSPFLRERIDILVEAGSLIDLIENVKLLPSSDKTFKTIFVNNEDEPRVHLHERRRIEREVGLELPGDVDMDHPDQLYGIIHVNETWYLGLYHKNETVWLKHQQKPHIYSTALNTRVARAVVNIALPHPNGEKVIDPCCGIGTVIVEALSMGIDIVGSDRNPIILPGTRENIAHFGYETTVKFMDIHNVTEQYDVAIIDMPYNLCSVISPEQQLEMIKSARSFTKRIVIVTLEEIDSVIVEAGFEILDRCVVNKGKVARQIIVCE